MRPTDFCHLYELRVPVPRVFPTHCPDFHRAGAPRSLGLLGASSGEGAFHTARDRFGGSFRTPTGVDSRPRKMSSPRDDDERSSVGVVFPRCSDSIVTSDIPVASSSCAESGVAFAILRFGALAPSLAPS